MADTNLVAATTTPIEADQNIESDSASGDDQSTYTQSLKSSLLQSVVENGRGYHKYHDGAYILPDDQKEQERLDMQHTMILKTFGGKLTLVPFEQPPQSALDLGTGTGIWAVDFADTYPDCQVTGVDLSPMQPALVPSNCKFEIDDYESEWTYSHKFDLIHGRLMTTSMADPPKLFQRAFESLNAGGWFEMQDLYMPIKSDDGTMTEDSAFHKWNVLVSEAVRKLGREVGWASEYKAWMEQTGFVNVQQINFKIPINTWPKDKNLKELGRWNLINMIEGLEGYTVRPLTMILGMGIGEVEALMENVRAELHNKKIHTYWNIYVVFGQKPST